MTGLRELHVHVATLLVVGGSTIEARRVADGLPAALERALAGRPAAAPGPAHLVADSVAQQVRAAVSAAVDAAGAQVGP